VKYNILNNFSFSERSLAIISIEKVVFLFNLLLHVRFSFLWVPSRISFEGIGFLTEISGS